ncbi:MAG: cryptochrome/photolyase family protein [Ruegeria sp.]
MQQDHSPIIFWFRRDLRLSDHSGLSAVAATGRPIIPVFILDEVAETLGSAPKWRLGIGLETFGSALEEIGSRLILRRGPALKVIRQVIDETGANSVHWSRSYDPGSINRDRQIKEALQHSGVEARSHQGHLLFEPWTVANKSGQPFKVFTPMWRAVRSRDVEAPSKKVSRLVSPREWPESEALRDWCLGQAMQRGKNVVSSYASPGEGAAHDWLHGFLENGVRRYAELRDRPNLSATSNLSEYLSLGEIGPRTIWHGAIRAGDGEAFLRQLAWREFAYHLMFHFPGIVSGNWKPEWNSFPWITDPDHPHVEAWKQARTGVPMVDAGLREMYVTGRMHNRSRMIVASYLTKHLMVHWKIGMDWFAECLTDWDPAANAMGWQWVAGSGPDAAPYFRVFNPEIQQKRFDPEKEYVRRWIAEGRSDPSEASLDYFRAVPRSWELGETAMYSSPIVDLDTGRRTALAAYDLWKNPVRN